MSDTIMRIPAVALRGTLVMPDMIMHFDISRSR